MASQLLNSLYTSLAKRGTAGRTEADIQSDIKTLLVAGGLDLAEDQLEVFLEAQTGVQQRIDIEVGFTAIEVKKDLRSQLVMTNAIDQLRGYVMQRTESTGARYVGVLTDGNDWYLYALIETELVEASHFALRSSEDGPALLSWLSTVLATTQSVKATPKEIDRRFGASSPAHDLDLISLRALWDAHSHDGELQLKKELWGKLLHTALGENFSDDLELFIQHTYLVIVAELIAHEVLGIDVKTLDPLDLVTGSTFTDAGVLGVVESDFFDWPAEFQGGGRIVQAIARRVSQIDWTTTKHDLLKHLYESVINTEQRKNLGEYYTPDWLAEAVVEDVVDDPGSQRVLDPACGSGTFIFHSVRRALDTMESAGMPNEMVLDRVTRLVYGMDVHPVAVTLARVTYLLALGSRRLNGPRNIITVPVYLGDSVQWGNVHSILNSDGLTVPTNDGKALFTEELFFPQVVLDDPVSFGKLVDGLVRKATNRARGSAVSDRHKIGDLLRKYALTESERKAIDDTYSLLCHLHDVHRNHIWAYFIKNLSRPLWLSRDDGKVDRIVGNPPWLSYRFMDATMQKNFKTRSEARNLWVGGNVATQQDLSAYFLVRTSELYLRSGGSFGVVLPNATLSRKATEGFRSAKWGIAGTAQFDSSWDLDKVRPHLFPVPACVVTGVYRTPEDSAVGSPLLRATEKWSGTVPAGNDWSAASPLLNREPESEERKDYARSPYGENFRQGATIVPRVLHLVEKVVQKTALGLPSGQVSVKSVRSGLEKKPWKDLPSRGPQVLETQFVRPVLFGASLLPFRPYDLEYAVLPVSDTGILTPKEIGSFAKLNTWWSEANELWDKHGAGKMTLLARLEYMKGLSSQFPLAPLRVAYSASGNRLTACLIDDQSAVIEHNLYWSAVTSRSEGTYLVAILNSQAAQEWVEPLQSRGLLGARHFDKYVWDLPIPRFDEGNQLHVRLADLGRCAEELAGAVDVPPNTGFQKARRIVREALIEQGMQAQIEAAVTELFALGSKA